MEFVWGLFNDFDALAVGGCWSIIGAFDALPLSRWAGAG